MGQLQNVQRGQMFFYFIYSVFIFIAVLLKFCKNRIDTTGNSQESKGNKYEDKKAQKKEQNTVDQLDKNKQNDAKVQENTDNSDFDSTMPGKFVKRMNEIVYFFLPMIFPFAINLITGSSYGFLLFWFFVVKITFILVHVLKIHENCVQNKIIKAIFENLMLIFSFIFWVNIWATGSSVMPYFIEQA